MTVAAAIKFTQGFTTAAPGIALLGATGTQVSVNNGDDANVISWSWEILSVPTGSAVGTGVIQEGPISTFQFTPDLTGCYLVRLTVQDAFDNFARDTRTFGVLETSGRLIPPFGGTDSSMNFGGQTLGWAAYVDEYLKHVDAGGGGSGTVTNVTATAPIVVATGTTTPALSFAFPSEARGDVTFRGAAAWQRLPASGTPGYVLASQGAGADPAWTPNGGQRLTPIDANTALRWSLDEVVSPWAHSGNAVGTLNMITNVSTALTRTGLFGNALDFHLAAIKTGDTSLGEAAGDLSASVWVNKRTDAGIGHIFGKAAKTGTTWGGAFVAFSFYMNGTSDGLWSTVLVTAAGTTTKSMTIPWGIPANQWTLISFTYAKVAGTLSCYLNGTLCGTSAITPNSAIAYDLHGPYYLGGRTDNNTQCYDGIIDEVLVEPGVVRSASYYQTMYKQGLRLLDP